MKPTLGTVLSGAAVTTVIAAVVAGIFVLGSPTEERARGIDRRRVADLRAIAAATDLYWTRHSQLPATLDDLSTRVRTTVFSARGGRNHAQHGRGNSGAW